MCVRKVRLREYERITYHLLPKLSIHLLYSHTYEKKTRSKQNVLVYYCIQGRKKEEKGETMKG